MMRKISHVVDDTRVNEAAFARSLRASREVIYASARKTRWKLVARNYYDSDESARSRSETAKRSLRGELRYIRENGFQNIA